MKELIGDFFKITKKMKTNITDIKTDKTELWLNKTQDQLITFLTHFSPVPHFYTPWKRQKTYGFSDVYRGDRNVTLD